MDINQFTEKLDKKIERINNFETAKYEVVEELKSIGADIRSLSNGMQRFDYKGKSFDLDMRIEKYFNKISDNSTVGSIKAMIYDVILEG